MVKCVQNLIDFGSQPRFHRLLFLHFSATTIYCFWAGKLFQNKEGNSCSNSVSQN